MMIFEISYREYDYTMLFITTWLYSRLYVYKIKKLQTMPTIHRLAITGRFY